ncbi:MAG: group II intron reverse transcriptase/maturase [Pontiellaceae bacterium]|nr:group II intron reverse transcriptase/maturase [Pontiellaceae bacterium]
MTLMPNSIAAFGIGAESADLVLRFALKLKEHAAPVMVLDYSGRGALILDQKNQMGLSQHPVRWYNVADRRRPVALFQLGNSEFFRHAFLRALQGIQQISGAALRPATLEWAAEAAFNLSRSGTVGLGSLLKTLATVETRRWFLDTRQSPEDLSVLLKMLQWALRFPAVYAISESINPSHLDSALVKKGVIWVEVPFETFEDNEHALLCALIDVTVGHAVRMALTQDRQNNRHRGLMTVIHLYPPGKMADTLPDWIRESAHAVKHVGVHCIQPNSPLAALQVAWAKEASAVWVSGKVPKLNKDAHAVWLNSTELEHIDTLDGRHVWIRQNRNGKSFTARVHPAKEDLGVAHALRRNAAKARRSMRVGQMSAALDSVVDSIGEGCDLYRRLCDREMLRLAWFRVKNARKDSHGTDGVTIAQFEKNLENELDLLVRELEDGSYRCKPLRRLQIPKPDGGKRDISIVTVRDRIAQIACLNLLEPLFEPTFSRFSFAFRPRRSAHQALAVARSRIATGHTWVVIADIRKCFDSIDHDLLLNLLAHRVADSDILRLVQHWLEIEVLDFEGLLPTIVGVPQGESLSPLLANIYLDPLDKHLERLGITFVRYADDILLLTNSQEEAQNALEMMKAFLLESLRLELKPAKTNFVPLHVGFDFLGFTFDAEKILIKQHRVEDIKQLLCDHLKTLGDPASSLGQRADSLQRINAIIRGWRNYFALPDEQAIVDQLRLIDGIVDQMAQYYLPADLRNDPVWICRERFTLPAPSEEPESEQESLARDVKIGSGYPEAPNPADPTERMIKSSPHGHRRNLAKSRPPSLEEDETTTLVSLKEGIVEHNRRLFILTHGVYLSATGGEIVVKKRKEELYRQSLKNLCLVFLQGYGITISVDLQLHLAESDIAVVFAPAVGEQMAVLTSTVTSRSALRGLQVLRRDDADVVNVGLKMLAAKMGNQAALLQYFAKYRKKTLPELGRQLIKVADDIRDLSTKILTIDPALPTVRSQAMGLEGHAASLYWRQIMAMIPEELGFCRRVTLGAKDPVNQCLNYVYGMLYGEVWRAVMKAGLDPYFGVMHGSKRDQGSLVFDLIEEFRAPFADRLVVGMLGRGFRPAVGEDGTLKTRTRKQLALCFSKNWVKKTRWRSHRLEPVAILAQQTLSFAKLYKREGEYQPFRMRW